MKLEDLLLLPPVAVACTSLCFGLFEFASTNYPYAALGLGCGAYYSLLLYTNYKEK